MAGISAYAGKVMLDYVCGGATPTRPAAWGVGLSLGTPNATAGSEIGTGSGYSRLNPGFAAAASPADTVSNANAMTYGPFSSGATVLACQVWDTAAGTAGNMLFFGQLATPRTIGAGDLLMINAGALVIGVS